MQASTQMSQIKETRALDKVRYLINGLALQNNMCSLPSSCSPSLLSLTEFGVRGTQSASAVTYLNISQTAQFHGYCNCLFLKRFMAAIPESALLTTTIWETIDNRFEFNRGPDMERVDLERPSHSNGICRERYRTVLRHGSRKCNASHAADSQ
jgi:hypothetical protein